LCVPPTPESNCLGAAKMPYVTELPIPEIYTAAKRGDAEAVASCLAADKAAACAVDPSAGGKTALAAAAGAGHVDVVKALLEAGAVDAPVKGWSAASHASFYGREEVLSALISAFGAAAVASPDGATMSPLLLACAKGHLACATLVLDASPGALATCDASGRTPRMLAATGGNPDLITYLAKCGAELDATCDDGMTALMWAVVSHQARAVSALAVLGADPAVRKNLNPNAAIRPGKQPTEGEDVLELADTKHARDPTMRFLRKYLEAYVAHRAERPGEAMPALEALPWTSHAEAFVAAEAQKETEAAAGGALVEEVATSAESDIFGEADAAADVPSGGGEDGPDAPVPSPPAPKTDGDLDDLD
jgi:ankyrin repeat protein